jgi:hypothetical protein
LLAMWHWVWSINSSGHRFVSWRVSSSSGKKKKKSSNGFSSHLMWNSSCLQFPLMSIAISLFLFTPSLVLCWDLWISFPLNMLLLQISTWPSPVSAPLLPSQRGFHGHSVQSYSSALYLGTLKHIIWFNFFKLLTIT